MRIEQIKLSKMATFCYLIGDEASGNAALIDPAFDAARIVATATRAGYRITHVINTHHHADHTAGNAEVIKCTGARLYIHKDDAAALTKISGKAFARMLGGRGSPPADHRLSDGEPLRIGTVELRVLHTPGHTPACMTHVIGNAAFVGDTLFMPDAGTARADFPGGDAATLFKSIQKILSLPARTKIYMCHDYGAEGRELEYKTTVKEELESNIHVNEKVAEADFVAMREARDRTLDVPHLILPSLQVNMRAGHLPDPESNGRIFLKIPLDALR